MDIEECPICLEENEDVIVFECKHYICESCYYKYISYHHTCPICRSTIIDEELSGCQTYIQRRYTSRRTVTYFIIFCCLIAIFALYYIIYDVQI